ncbi:MAG TPA: hypothetical protein GX743_04735 [Actinomycetales bacterium]|nr:hypothetical protein [Actinomycetales bacterium]
MKAWKAAVLALVLGLVAGGVVGLSGALQGLNPFGTVEESSSSRVIEAIEREEEVVLLSLGIQGLEQENVASTLFGNRVPGTGRAVFLQYTYRAKLGIDGADVQIEELGPNAYVITIPEFLFIGYDDVSFSTVLEENGLISWVTPEIDTADFITRILDQEAMAAHVESNRDILEDQARLFYTAILKAVDEEIVVKFDFAPASRR